MHVRLLIAGIVIFPVSLIAQDSSFFDFKVSGIVPDGARYGVLQAFQNCAGCARGPVDVVLASLSYVENNSGKNLIDDPNFALGARNCSLDPRQTTLEPSASGSGQQLHTIGTPTGPFITCPDQRFAYPVTAGAVYVATFRARISRSSAGGGAFAAIFLTCNVPFNVMACEIHRDSLSFQSTIVGLALSQSGFTVRAVAGGGTPPPRTLSILNGTNQTLNFTATAATTNGGPWLSISPTSGSVDPSSTPPTIQINANPASLAPGDYYGQIRVDALGAPNTPQIASVVLNVAASTTNPGPVVEPTGLVFVAPPGSVDPSAQSITITDITNRPEPFSADISFSGTKNPFVVSPTSGTAAPNKPATVSVQPHIAGLSPGTYRANLLLAFPQDMLTKTIDLLLVISPSAISTTSKEQIRAASSMCTPTRLLPVFTLLGTNFTVSAAWPTALEVKVVDDCGTALKNGSVLTSFTNGDPAIALLPLTDGRWAGTWAPRNAITPSLKIKASAASPDLKLQGTVEVGGMVNDNPGVPVVNPGGVVNAGSFAPSASPSPGELISIFGTNLANALEVATALPLNTQMQGTTVSLGGRLLPLIATSDTQINAVVPYDVPSGSTQQLVVIRNNRLALPQTVQIAPAEPAIFTVDLSGKGQGDIFVIGSDGSQILADAQHPAKPGEVIVIYGSGLGTVNPSAQAGSATPSDALRQTDKPTTLSIAGVSAKVLFAGLTPGLTGLYQINAVVPDGVTPGASVPVVVTVGGFGGPAVTMAVAAAAR